jgi:hypothetical protein
VKYLLVKILNLAPFFFLGGGVYGVLIHLLYGCYSMLSFGNSFKLRSNHIVAEAYLMENGQATGLVCWMSVVL